MKCEGQLYRTHSFGIDAFFTPDHRLLVMPSAAGDVMEYRTITQVLNSKPGKFYRRVELLHPREAEDPGRGSQPKPTLHVARLPLPAGERVP